MIDYPGVYSLVKKKDGNILVEKNSALREESIKCEVLMNREGFQKGYSKKYVLMDKQKLASMEEVMYGKQRDKRKFLCQKYTTNMSKIY